MCSFFMGICWRKSTVRPFKILDSIRAVEKTFIPFVGLLSSKFFPMYMAKSCVNRRHDAGRCGQKGG